MFRYVLGRLAVALLTVFAVTSSGFSLLRLSGI
jgi:hypothetical protein